MNTNDTRNNESEERSWLDRLTQMVTGTPYTRADLEGLLQLAVDNEVIDDDARNIMEGALTVGEMQARDAMIPRAQMVVIRSGATLDEVLPQIIHTYQKEKGRYRRLWKSGPRPCCQSER